MQPGSIAETSRPSSPQDCVSASADLLILNLASTCQGWSNTLMARRLSMAQNDQWKAVIFIRR